MVVKDRAKHNLVKLVGLSAIVVFFIVAPVFLKAYPMSVLTLFCINIILVMSFRLLIIVGRWSFGHVALMSVGAYTSALLSSKLLSLPFWLTLPLGGLGAALIALVISYPCLRTKGFYFFLATFAAGEAIRQTYIRFGNPFGSFLGIEVIRPNPILGISFLDPVSNYYLVLGFTALSGFLMYWLERSRIGDTARAIALSGDLVESIGVNTRAYQTAVFVIASFFAGIAGVLFAHYTGYINPDNFTGVYMFNVITWTIIGGTASFAGPIAGLIVVTAYTEALRGMLEWVPFINGVIIIVILMFFPGGLERIPTQILRAMRKRVVR